MQENNIGLWFGQASCILSHPMNHTPRSFYIAISIYTLSSDISWRHLTLTYHVFIKTQPHRFQTNLSVEIWHSHTPWQPTVAWHLCQILQRYFSDSEFWTNVINITELISKYFLAYVYGVIILYGCIANPLAFCIFFKRRHHDKLSALILGHWPLSIQ